MKRDESRQELYLIVANDPVHDFDLVQEAWIGPILII
jgi:hypothetical protein